MPSGSQSAFYLFRPVLISFMIDSFAASSETRPAFADDRISAGTRIIRGAAAGFLLSILTNAFLFVGQMLIPRILSRAEYGQFTVCISFVALLSIVADLGMNSMFTRLFAQAEEEVSSGGLDRRGTLLGSAIVLRLFMSGIVVILVFTIGPWLYSVSMVNRMAILLLTFLISSRMLIVRAVGEAVQRGRGKYYLAALFGLPDAVAFAVLLVYGQYHAFTLTGVLWVYTLCNLPGFILLVISIVSWMRREHIGLHIDGLLMIDMLRKAIPLSIGTAFLTIHTQIDSLLLDKLSTPFEVSSYGATVRLFSALGPIAVVLAAVIAPELTRLLHRGDRERSYRLTGLSLRLLLVLAGAIALFLSAASNDVILVLLGSKYVSSGPLLGWTGWMLLPVFTATLLMEASVAAGKYWIPTAYAAVIMVAVIIGDVLLIGPFGAAGAMASKLIALSLGVIVLVWLSCDSGFLHAASFVSALMRIGVATGVALATLWVLRGHLVSDWLTGAAVLLVFFFMIHITRVLGLQEVIALLKRFRMPSMN
jgi:O-antigen/teichoic acid export membrane protein